MLDKRTTANALLALALLFGNIVWMQHGIDQAENRRQEEGEYHLRPPNAAAVRVASLGYYDLVADAYWLQAIQYTSTLLSLKKVPDDLIGAAQFITDLDPRFEFVYIFTGVILSVAGGNSGEIEKVLLKGRQNLPQSWKIAFYLGFVQYFLGNQYEAAAQNLDAAAQLSGYLYYAVLASRIRAEGGNPELSIAFLEQILQKTESGGYRSTIERRIKELRVAEQLKFLNLKLEEYQALYGRRAASWDDLFRAGLLHPSEMPVHPLAGYYFIDPKTGQAESSVKIYEGVYIPPRR
jgi:hypothetical protein